MLEHTRKINRNTNSTFANTICENYTTKMSEIMDIRFQHHLAQEFYRQQMLQRIPGNVSTRKSNLPLYCGNLGKKYHFRTS